MTEGIHTVVTFGNIKGNAVSDGIDRMMSAKRRLKRTSYLEQTISKRSWFLLSRSFEESIALFIQIGLYLEVPR